MSPSSRLGKGGTRVELNSVNVVGTKVYFRVRLDDPQSCGCVEKVPPVLSWVLFGTTTNLSGRILTPGS